MMTICEVLLLNVFPSSLKLLAGLQLLFCLHYQHQEVSRIILLLILSQENILQQVCNILSPVMEGLNHVSLCLKKTCQLPLTIALLDILTCPYPVEVL